MQRLLNLARRAKNHINTHRKLSIFMGVISIVLLYAIVFFMPQPIQFSYSGNSCAGRLTLLPQIQNSPDNSKFAVTFHDNVKVGSFALASFKTCVKPTVPPKEGTVVASVAPFGSLVARYHLAVTVPPAPKVSASTFNQPFPASKPLKIGLSSTDATFIYTLEVADKSVKCTPVSRAVKCNVPELGLSHDEQYTAILTRQFKSNNPVTVLDKSVQTLKAISITDGSIKAQQTVYDKPTTLIFTADHDLVSAEATLESVGEGADETIPVGTTVKGKTLTVSLRKQLAREREFSLTIAKVEAANGSTLSAPFKVPFTTSGGPTVKSVSIGATNVPQSARIVLAFDQPVHDEVDISKFVKAQGVAATVARISSTEVALSIQNAPLCAAFSIEVQKGIKSASNDEISAKPWQFTSRTVCGVARIIGYSLQGRPIIAHYFGSGNTTILFSGGIHGTEYSARQTTQAWVDYLYSNAHQIPADRQVVVVPNVNPDGNANGTRNNSRNVNVDRNFPTANWSSRIDTASGELSQGGGVSPLSEPEAAALATITRQLRPRLSVSIHAQGRLVGANKYGDSVTVGNIYASIVGYGTMYHNAEEVMGYPITGEYEDWMGEELNVPAILIELPSHYGNYLSSQLAALLRMVKI